MAEPTQDDNVNKPGDKSKKKLSRKKTAATTKKTQTRHKDSGADTSVAASLATPHKPSKGPMAVSIIALLISLTIAAIGAMFVLRTQDKIGIADRQTSQLDQAVAQLKQAATEESRKLSIGLQAIHESETRLQNSIKALFSEVGRSKSDWAIAEAEYLIVVANHRLLLEQDMHTALTALQLAKQRIKDVEDPKLVAVRTSLNTDIATLEQHQGKAKLGPMSRIDSLLERLDDLPLVSAARSDARPTGEQPLSVDKAADETPIWETAMRELGQILSELVIIRRQDESLLPLLTPRQQFFLFENLRLQLETARLAALRRDALLYKQTLQRTAKWLRQHFDENAERVKSFLQEVNKLEDINVAPTMPDISASLAAIRSVGKEHAKAAVPADQPDRKTATETKPDKDNTE
ncbi:MAG: hypothetical protein BMS9Abin26_0424 [Gammaproteobacteria bacterium]|nr:MAG: hypothetical protein BMS9Abin26_0424 [Gammaproteobacteria bacterium]